MQSEIETHIAAVDALYRPLILGRESLLRGGAKLWCQFESAVAAYRASANPTTISGLAERVNELAVARLLLKDPERDGNLEYEPGIIPDGRRIDFVIFGPTENTYVEVKTVHPQAEDSEANWQKYVDRRKYHPANTHYLVRKGWLGAETYTKSFSARAHFLEYAQQFETRLGAATAVRPGRGILAFCGTGFAWTLDQLEDFANFYIHGKHRQDDVFGPMEAHGIQRKEIELLRNISAFAFVKRRMDQAKPSQCIMPVRGPHFLASA